MAYMTDKEFEIFSHFMRNFKRQWDMNEYARNNYNEELEHFIGFRDASNYPMAYNMVINKLLPRVETMLGRCMDQLFQPASHNIIGVRARNSQNYMGAQRVEGLMNTQCERLNDVDVAGGLYMFLKRWIETTFWTGSGIAKLYWRKEERIMPKRISIPQIQYGPQGQPVGMQMQHMLTEAPQIIYDGPYAEVLPNKLCVPDIRYKHIDQMPFFFVVYKRSMDYLKKMEDKGIYKNIDKIGTTRGERGYPVIGGVAGEESAEAFWKSIEIEGAQYLEESRGDLLSPEVDILECYGKVILEDNPYEIGAGNTVKGREVDVIVHIANYDTIISIQENKTQKKPFFKLSCYEHPELFWDIGIVRLGKVIQEQYNNLQNTRFENAMMLVNQMLMINMNADLDPESLIWKPYGIIPVQDVNNDVKPLMTNDISQHGIFREQEEMLSSSLDEVVGMYEQSMGAPAVRQEYPGTVMAIQQMAEQRTRLILRSMDKQGFEPFLRYMMELNTLYLDPAFEARISGGDGDQFIQMLANDLHGNYDFSVKFTGAEPTLSKTFRAQQILQLAPTLLQSPWAKQGNLLRTILQLMDVHEVDGLLKTDQEVMAEQQQQMQQQAQMAMMDKQADAEIGQGEIKSKIMGDVIKELMRG